MMSQRLNDVEEARRDDEEKKLQAKDKRRMKKLTQMNLPLAIANVTAANDPMMVGAPGVALACLFAGSAPLCRREPAEYTGK